MKKLLLFTLLFSVLYSCKTVPLTGRRQLTLIPASTMNSLAATSFQEVRATSKLSTNAEQTAMVQRVGERIKKAVEEYLAANNLSDRIKGFQWEFILIEDPTVNAWCMPGGKVAFYTGILPICQNEAGVAVVMGHEIAHAIANHSAERMSQELIQQMGGVTLSAAMAKQPEKTQSLALTAFGVGSTVFGILPYSRKHEYEADRLGTIFMAMAGYNPNEAPKFWERMQALSGNKSTVDFLSTHPADTKRIAELNKVVPEAMRYYKP
ncbi:MAG: M48 family metallopeptidase [Bacteroidales bacterium]|jgi:predicted Zn-dependent protease|nr:M48 family metallopeptidase [Bacteroidales bacterium]